MRTITPVRLFVVIALCAAVALLATPPEGADKIQWKNIGPGGGGNIFAVGVSPADPKADSLAKAADVCEVDLACRSASDPSGSRAVSVGSSTNTVPVPTTMASATVATATRTATACSTRATTV